MWPFKKKIVHDGMPDAEWVREHQLSGYTYDDFRLGESEYNNVFIYDQMMRGMRMHESLLKDNALFLGVAFTVSERWTLWKKKLGVGSFPIAILTPLTMVNQAQIRGQLFMVKSNWIKRLDEYKLNGVEFRRKRVEVVVPYERRENGRIVQGIGVCNPWMYTGRWSHWGDQLDAGYSFSTVRQFTPNDTVLDKPYYAFTPLEYDE